MPERARRLFFALWPDDATRALIADRTAGHVKAAGGRPTAREKLHVTVAFLGSVADSRLSCVEEAAGRLAGVCFELVLARVDHWLRSRILSLQALELPPDLDTLVADLWQGLRACAFEPDPRPYRAHVTLARDAQAPRGLTPDIEPIVWPVRELCLLESVTAPEGARYERLRSWPLAYENPVSSAGITRCRPPDS
jgi:2'-5' RNA ligase